MFKKFTFLFLVLSVLSACQIGSQETTNEIVKNNQPIEKAESKPVEEIQPQAQKSFDEMVSEFNDIYKKALFATGQSKIEEALTTTKKSLNLWESIEKQFLNDQPATYQKSQNWSEQITAIGDKLRMADAFNQEEKFSDAHTELEFVRKALKELRGENNLQNLSDQMLIFHDTMEELTESSEKNMELLEKLKNELEPILSANQEEAYQKQAQELNLILQTLREKDGEEYQTALNKLKPTFIKFYLQFG